MLFKINPDSIKAQSAVFLTCSSSMKGYADDILAVAGDLTSSLSESRPSLEAIAAEADFSFSALEKHSEALVNIADAYIKAENDNLAREKSGDRDDLNDEINDSCDGAEAFDDEGSYGGNQMKIQQHVFWYDTPFPFLGKDKYLYDFIREHEGYENMTNEEIQRLLKDITGGGCYWVAMANMIMAEYEGRPEDFERDFGFPMYTEKGDLNYDQLVIDLYCSTQGKYYIGDDYDSAIFALDCSITQHYADNPEEFKEKYGFDFYDEDGNVNPDAYDAIKQERDDLIAASDGECVIYNADESGISNPSEMNNRMMHYLNSKGIDGFTYEKVSHPTNDEIQNAIDSGKTVVISITEYNLYNEDGSLYMESDGSHAVVVTGITPDGKYIVSSWGKKLIYDPNEKLTDDGYSTTVSVYYYDIEE